MLMWVPLARSTAISCSLAMLFGATVFVLLATLGGATEFSYSISLATWVGGSLIPLRYLAAQADQVIASRPVALAVKLTAIVALFVSFCAAAVYFHLSMVFGFSRLESAAWPMDPDNAVSFVTMVWPVALPMVWISVAPPSWTLAGAAIIGCSTAYLLHDLVTPLRASSLLVSVGGVLVAQRLISGRRSS